MADEKLKLPRSAYGELCRIIMAYGRINKPSSLEEITHRSGVHRSNVSANNAFLTVIGLIEGGKTKSMTPKGTRLAQALEHEIPDEIAKAWRIVVEENDFLSKMALAVQIRKGMEESQFEAHIAYSAGEAKSGAVMTGARAVIDILRASGLVKEEGDQILPTAETAPPSGPEGDLVPQQTEPQIGQLSPLHITSRTLPSLAPKPAGLSLHIEVRIDVKPSELDGLGEKLKALIESISGSSIEKAQ